MDTVTFNIPSISCSACSNKIRENIGTMNGIADVRADMITQTVEIEYNPSEIQPQEIKKKILSMGYEVVQ